MTEEKQIPEGKPLSWYLYYKFDRSLAVFGIIVVALWAVWLGRANADALNLANAAIGGLVGYIGGRSAT